MAATSINTNLFEYATRNRIRFASARGEIDLEQLWDVPLRSRDGFDLNTIAKTASRTHKDLSEESFVEAEKKTLAQVRAEMALEVVKCVIATKLEEEETAKKRAERKAEKEKLLAILAEKQEGRLSTLSENEIKRRIQALED